MDAGRVGVGVGVRRGPLRWQGGPGRALAGLLTALALGLGACAGEPIGGLPAPAVMDAGVRDGAATETARGAADAGRFDLGSTVTPQEVDGPATAEAPALRFEPPGAAFVDAVTVALQGPSGTTIHYTLDGTVPTTASPVYRAPLTVRETTVVRALAVGAPGGTAVANAAAFVRLAADLSGWSSNLPVVLVHTHESGPLQLLSNDRVNGSVSVFTPGPSGRTQLVGTPALSGRAGVRIHGNTSRAFPQKSFNIELRHPLGDQEQARPLLDFPAEGDFVLVGPSFMDRTLVRAAVGFALSNEMGLYAPRVRLVEAFVSEKRGVVGASDYLGVFALVERIGRGAQRVPIAKLEPSAQTPPAVTGGYIFRIDHMVDDFMAGGVRFGFVYPDHDEMMQPQRQAQRAYLQGHMQEIFEALASAEHRHPRTGLHYTRYLDVRSFIDFHLVNTLLKNVDAFRLSTYFSKDRQGLVKAGPLWDLDRSSGTPYDPRAVNAAEWFQGDAAHPLTYGLWGQLYSDPTYKAAHARRFAELVAGPFSVAHLHALVDRFAGQVSEAQQRHFARWPELPAKGGSHAAEVKVLKDWFAARVPWLVAQLPPP